MEIERIRIQCDIASSRAIFFTYFILLINMWSEGVTAISIQGVVSITHWLNRLCCQPCQTQKEMNDEGSKNLIKL